MMGGGFTDNPNALASCGCGHRSEQQLAHRKNVNDKKKAPRGRLYLLLSKHR